MVKGLVHGMEAAGTQYGKYFVPNSACSTPLSFSRRQLYPQVMHTLRELAGGRHDHAAVCCGRFRQSCYCPIHWQDAALVRGQPERAGKTLQTDLGRGGFGVCFRHTQYEMFYASAAFCDARSCFPHLCVGYGDRSRRAFPGHV